MPPRRTSRRGGSDQRIDEGRPLKVVTFDENGIRLHTEELSILLGRDDVRDYPVSILSVVGVYRTGKSFLLNYLLRYLRAQGKKDWQEAMQEPLLGFDWRQGVDTTTFGIHLWSKPFHVKADDGTEVALLLMDTQGLFDNTLSQKNASAMFALSTLLSCTQVYNIVGKVEEPHLKHLELYLEVSRMVLALLDKRHSDQCFQRLVCLIRDWPDPERYPYGADGGRLYLSSMRESQDHPSDIKKLMENVQSCFTKFEFYLMPHPGIKAVVKETAEESSNDGQMETDDKPFCGQLGDLRPFFRKYLPKVASFLLDPKNIAVKKRGGNEMDGKYLHHFLEECVSILNSGIIPDFPSSRKLVLAEFNNYQAKLIDEFHKHYFKEKSFLVKPTHSFRHVQNWTREVKEKEDGLIEKLRSISGGEQSQKNSIVKQVKNCFRTTKMDFYKTFNSNLFEVVLKFHRRRADQIYDLQNPDRLKCDKKDLKRKIKGEEQLTRKYFRRKALGGESDRKELTYRIGDQLRSWKECIHQEQEQVQMTYVLLDKTFAKVKCKLAEYESEANMVDNKIKDNLEELQSLAHRIDVCIRDSKIFRGIGFGSLFSGTAAIIGGIFCSPLLVAAGVVAVGSAVLSAAGSSFLEETTALKTQAQNSVLDCKKAIQERRKLLRQLKKIISQNSGDLDVSKLLHILLSAQAAGVQRKDLSPQALWYMMKGSVPPTLNIDTHALFLDRRYCSWDHWEEMFTGDMYVITGEFLRKIIGSLESYARRMKQHDLLLTKLPNEN